MIGSESRCGSREDTKPCTTRPFFISENSECRIEKGGLTQRPAYQHGTAAEAGTFLYSLFFILYSEGLLTLAAGLGSGALLIGVAWKLASTWSLALLNLLAFTVGLSAIGDLTALFRITTSPAGAALSDAHAMAQLTSIPAVFWAVAWVIVAVALLGSAFWATWLKKRA